MVRTASSCALWVSFEESENHPLSCSLHHFFPGWLSNVPSLMLSKLHTRFFWDSVIAGMRFTAQIIPWPEGHGWPLTPQPKHVPKYKNVFVGLETGIQGLLITSVKSSTGSCSLPDRNDENLRLFCMKPYVFWFVCFPDVSKIRLTEAPCLGCFHHISSDGPEVSEILEKAIQKFNRHSEEHALFKLVEIKEAKRQVCAWFFSKFCQNIPTQSRYLVCFMYVSDIKLAYIS